MSEEDKKPEESKEEEYEEGGEDETPKEEESTATFAPVVQLEVVEVTTGTEEEEELYSQRAKLFIYGETLLDKGTGNKSWRERGVGQLTLLKHRELQKIRLLMRQDKTMKVIANHVVDPRIELQENVSSDRSWVWTAFDFAEGELVETIFAVRFGDSDIAKKFKEEFEKCQEEMKSLLAGADAPDADKTGDEATKALEGLAVTGQDDAPADA